MQHVTFRQCSSSKYYQHMKSSSSHWRPYPPFVSLVIKTSVFIANSTGDNIPLGLQWLDSSIASFIRRWATPYKVRHQYHPRSNDVQISRLRFGRVTLAEKLHSIGLRSDPNSQTCNVPEDSIYLSVRPSTRPFIYLMTKRSERREHCELPMQARSVLHLCAEFGADCESRKLGHVTRTRPLTGRFMVPAQGGSVLYVCTKFEADSSFRSKFYRGARNFEIGASDPGHVHLGVVLYFIRRRDPYSIFVPYSKRIAQFVQKLLKGPEIRKLGHMTPPRPLMGRFITPMHGGSVLYVYTKFEADSSFRSKVI